MEEALGFLAVIAAFVAALNIVTATARGEQPTRGSYIVPQPEGDRPVEPPVITAPAAPLFHSRYCASRRGAPCDCKGPQA